MTIRWMLNTFFTIFCAASLFAQNTENYPVPDNVSVERDIVFGTGGGRDLKLNLFRPKSGNGPFPGIVFIHGGGWRNGSPTAFERQALRLASTGYVAICIEYRLSGEATFPAAIEDSKCAVRWLRANAKQYAVNPDKIAVSGGSAGGHLSLLVGTSGGVAELEGTGGHTGVSSAVQLVIAFNPVSYFPIKPDNPMIQVTSFLGGTVDEVPEAYRKASPPTWLDTGDPPMLLLHGTNDTTVPHQQSVKFMVELTKMKVLSKLYSEEGGGHGWFNRDPYYEPTYKALQYWLDVHFK